MKYASICRKSGKMVMSENTLLSLLKDDPHFNQFENPVSLKYPQVRDTSGPCMYHMVRAGILLNFTIAHVDRRASHCLFLPVWFNCYINLSLVTLGI